MLKYLLILICAVALAPTLRSEQDYVTRHSLSEQFVVYGPKASPLRRFKSERVPLDSSLVAVSCERIKQALLGELEGTGRRQINFKNQTEGKIYAVLHPKASEPVRITPIPTTDFLNYRIDLPNEIEATRLIDVVTETVLLEMVNRNASDRFTQIPRWLTQGLAAQVQAVNPESLVLEQHLPVTRVKVRLDPIAEIRRNRPDFSALTFDELSWPEMLSAEKAARYRQSAQLLVGQLLRLKDGRACLRQMLEELPNHSRWQIAFMRAFEPSFQRLVDVEKWWELTGVELTRGGAGKTLSHEQSVEQMDLALRVPVQVVQDFSAESKRNNLTLQEIISQWEPRRQNPAIEKAVSHLRVLHSRVRPEMVPLLEEYRRVLENYLQNDEKNLLGRIFARGNLEDLRATTRKQLDALDQRLTKFREQPKSIPSTREEAILSALEIAAQRKQ
jgi:hypothetical protein